MTYQILDHGRLYTSCATREQAESELAALIAARPYGYVLREATQPASNPARTARNSFDDEHADEIALNGSPRGRRNFWGR